MGTPDFAVPCLEAVYESQELVAVVTQPDRKSGRGQKIQYSPVKSRALEYDVPVYQPSKITTDHFYQILVELKADVIVVVAYGQKIPNRVLELAPHGCINVHSSLLPKYRGAAPIHRAIINGDDITGVTTMYLSEGWDEGDIILQSTEEILPTDTAGSLHDRLAIRGASLLSETLNQLENGTAPRITQDDSKASYAPKLDKSDGQIDWADTAYNLWNFVRGMNPWPTAYTLYENQMIKVWEASEAKDCSNINTKIEPGKVLAINQDGIYVGTGDGVLILGKLQRQGARSMRGIDLANGLRLKVGTYFGI